MKFNKTNIFIAISSVALLIVVIIQLDWIRQAEKHNEESFNEKANIVLARTSEALSSDKSISKSFAGSLGQTEKNKIDSLIKAYMDYYSFHEVFTFEIKMLQAADLKIETIGYKNYFTETQKPCYDKSFDNLAHSNGWELKIYFPNRKASILKEMGVPFAVSVVLILLVLILFWRTVRSLIAEKRISEHTTDFLNNMTHEFKTPLTSIALAGNLITKEATSKQEDEIKYNSEIILEENEKLRLQIEQVLSMTSLERGEIPIQKTELNFHELIKNSLKSIILQIENKQGNLKLDLKADHVMIMGDRTHLTNVMRNLLDNAIKYSIEKPGISIQTYNINRNLIITVADKGIGIAKEYQKKVFENFFRVPTGNIHNVKGFGLGLGYVKKIIGLHGGTIKVSSEKGSGTIFTITLPNE